MLSKNHEDLQPDPKVSSGNGKVLNAGKICLQNAKMYGTITPLIFIKLLKVHLAQFFVYQAV